MYQQQCRLERWMKHIVWFNLDGKTDVAENLQDLLDLRSLIMHPLRERYKHTPTCLMFLQTCDLSGWNGLLSEQEWSNSDSGVLSSKATHQTHNWCTLVLFGDCVIHVISTSKKLRLDGWLPVKYFIKAPKHGNLRSTELFDLVQRWLRNGQLALRLSKTARL